MTKEELKYLNNILSDANCCKLSIDELYNDCDILIKDNYLVDKFGNKIGTKGDMYHKLTLKKILEEGTVDKNPRPKYIDGSPAHTISINHMLYTYDINKGEFPLITLRPIAVKSAIGEVLWIYQDQSNNLDLLKDKYNVRWWDSWDIGDRTIGSVYGETVKRYNITKKLIEDIKNNPDGRRHIMSLWQEDVFKEKHALKPCAFMTIWNVRHGRDGASYLDMELIQRSSDFMAAGCINQMQYLALLYYVAKSCGYEVGRFSWNVLNVQIYSRHIRSAIKLLKREPVNCNPKYILETNTDDFFDMKLDDIKLDGYEKEKVKEKNPQIKLDLGI